MKKKYIPLVLALSCMLAACDGNNKPVESKPDTPTTSINGGSSVAAKYTVTATASQDYTVEGLKTEGYAEGETVTFTVNVTNNAKEIDKVVVNRVTLTPTNGTYSFTMGAANTIINVQLKDKANAKTATIVLEPATIEVGQSSTVTLKLDNVAVGEVSRNVGVAVHGLVAVPAAVDRNSHGAVYPVGYAEPEVKGGAAAYGELYGSSLGNGALLCYPYILVSPVQYGALVEVDVEGIVIVHIYGVAQLCEALHAASRTAPELVPACAVYLEKSRSHRLEVGCHTCFGVL